MKSYIVILLSAVAISASAQTVCGYVTDAQTGERLPNALVYNQTTKTTALSNAYGYYSLAHTAKGDTIVARFVGYVTANQVVRNAEKADIAETIERLHLGYETEISDSNTGGFSGGQRQRLLLARAFASKPDIMILDEATSALDNISQNKVLDSVYKENCTVVMVAHRLSTVRDCDRIVLIKEGRIAEQGTYDDLMKLRGEFYELMRRQSGTH